jgi:HEAT repeat protein
MRKRIKIVLAGLLVAAISVLVWQLLRPREPVYEGQSLTAWLRRSAGDDEVASNDSDPPRDPAGAERYFEAAREAELARTHATNVIRLIGTNAIPQLLKLAASKNSGPKKFLLAHVPEGWFVRRGFWNWYRSYRYKTFKDHELALEGFRILGPDARSAVPTLVTLLDDPDWDTCASAADSLYYIAPAAEEAIPALTRHLNGWLNVRASGALANMPWRPDLMVPGLTRNLQSPINSEVLWMTLERLGGCGAPAKAAVPAITPFLGHPNPNVRKAATNALREIGARAAANADPK